MSDQRPDDQFDNSDELHFENELLKLQLKAESGIDTFTNSELEPSVENDFLKHVLAFEHNYAKAQQIKIYDKLGRPAFTPVEDLDDTSIEAALTEVETMLQKNSVVIDYLGEYDAMTKYKFITTELFELMVYDMAVPGMMTHYTYEEFHPDHKMDIANRADEFLTEWFGRSLSERSWCIDDTFILPDGSTMQKGEVIRSFANIFSAYLSFTDVNHNVDNIDFQLQEKGGMGFAEGYAKYTAVLEDGGNVQIAGPFKLYLSLEGGWWSIFHIVFPGFEY